MATPATAILLWSAGNERAIRARIFKTHMAKKKKCKRQKFYDEEDVIGFDALYSSMFECKKGVLWKDSVAGYYHRGIEKTERLSEELHNGKYKPKPPHYFMVTSPKPREIASVCFRDRVYQRSLNDNCVYPIMTKSFIHDNYACQNGKGTDPARERLKEFFRKHYAKYGMGGCIVQVDIHGYYPNMRHDIAEAMFKKKLPRWAFRRARDILRQQYGDGIGYNPGSQLVQIAGISFLDKLDHCIKEQLHVKLYIRYMDDLILFLPTREEAERCMSEIEKYLMEVGFELNPKKTQIIPFAKGVTFLGFKYRITESGKVLMTADPAKVKAARKKYRRLAKKVMAGKSTRESADLSFQTWINHLSHGNSYNLIRRMTKWYNDLWKENENGYDQSTEDVPA